MFKRTRNHHQVRRLTLAGRLVLVATLVSGLAIINRAAAPWLALFLVAWGVHWVAGWLNRPRLTVRVDINPELQVGQSQGLQIRLTHRARVPVRDLYISLVPPGTYEAVTWITSIAATSRGLPSSQVISVDFVPIARGYRRTLTVHAESRFPFGWLRWWQTCEVDCPTWIAPAPMHDGLAEHASPVGETEEADLMHLLTPPTVTGIEQSGCREYVPGMHVRRWAQAAWARTQIPTVCEFSVETGPEVQMIALPALQPGPEYEAMLSAVMDFVDQWENTGENSHFRLSVWTVEGWLGTGWLAQSPLGQDPPHSAQRLLAEACALRSSIHGTSDLLHVAGGDGTKLSSNLERSIPAIVVGCEQNGLTSIVAEQLRDDNFEVYEIHFQQD